MQAFSKGFLAEEPPFRSSRVGHLIDTGRTMSSKPHRVVTRNTQRRV